MTQMKFSGVPIHAKWRQTAVVVEIEQTPSAIDERHSPAMLLEVTDAVGIRIDSPFESFQSN